MARRTILLAATVALVVGCGEPSDLPLTERGLRELRSGKYDEAITTCTAAIVADPKDPEAYLYRGRAYQNRNAPGDTDKAIADFTEAIAIAPNKADAYYSRAIVYRDLGDLEHALADDRAARQADHQLQDMYHQLPDVTAQGTIARVRQEIAKEKDAVKNAQQQAENGEGEKETQPASGNGARSEDEQRALYEQLKERFEPGFGKLDTSAHEPEEVGDSTFDSLPRRNARGVLENHRTDDESAPGDAPDQFFPFLAPRDFSSSGRSFDRSALPATPLPNSATTPPQTARPLPQSPFAPQAPPPEGVRQITSPFGRQTPSGTGFRSPSTTAVDPQPAAPLIRDVPTSNPSKYSNPAVRPPNPRDYVP